VDETFEYFVLISLPALSLCGIISYQAYYPAFAHFEKMLSTTIRNAHQRQLEMPIPFSIQTYLQADNQPVNSDILKTSTRMSSVTIPH
jgi:hypothetical protein